MSEERKEQIKRMFEKFDELPDSPKAYLSGFAAGVELMNKADQVDDKKGEVDDGKQQ